jgi:triacylglycerol esterase/lipase EstA (alpha/beta hydrolase family)
LQIGAGFLSLRTRLTLPMLARLQQGITLGALVLAAAWLAYWWQAGHAGWAVAGALVVLFGYAAILGVEFMLLAHINRDDPAPPSTLRQRLGAWWGEVFSAPAVFCWRQPFRSERWPDHLPAHAQGRRGVVLVHGFVCNRGIWNRWMPRLRALEVPHVAVNLEPVFGSIDDYAPLIDAAVRRVERATGLPPVIVAHSMGGLAARRWWSEVDDERLHRLVTIGTPHRGTWLARFAFSLNGHQMRLVTPWRTPLEKRESAARAQRVTCFYGHCDNIVFPASTATLPGADNRHLAAVAHVHMVDRPEPFAEVLRWVSPS